MSVETMRIRPLVCLFFNRSSHRLCAQDCAAVIVVAGAVGRRCSRGDILGFFIAGPAIGLRWGASELELDSEGSSSRLRFSDVAFC